MYRQEWGRQATFRPALSRHLCGGRSPLHSTSRLVELACSFAGESSDTQPRQWALPALSKTMRRDKETEDSHRLHFLGYTLQLNRAAMTAIRHLRLLPAARYRESSASPRTR